MTFVNRKQSLVIGLPLYACLSVINIIINLFRRALKLLLISSGEHYTIQTLTCVYYNLPHKTIVSIVSIVLVGFERIVGYAEIVMLLMPLQQLCGMDPVL